MVKGIGLSVNFYTKNAYQGYPQLQRDVNDVKGQVAQVDSIDEKVEKAFFGSIPPVRRVMSLPDKLEKGDTLAALGAATIAVTLLPEDIRDIRNAYNQVSAKIKGTSFVKPYENVKYQHDWSFLKGSLIDYFVKKMKDSKARDAIMKWYDADESLYNTKFGEKVKGFLGITDGLSIPAKNMKDRFGGQMYVTEIQTKSLFGELTGRAMKRTTKIGAILLAALELPRIFKAMNQGENITEQAGNTVKQTAKSAVNVTSLLAGIGYCGAYGAKRFGAIGSLVGMGIGAVVGATASDKIQDVIG